MTRCTGAVNPSSSNAARLQLALAAQPAIDQSRVDAISKALAAGSYRTHGDNIARGLIHTERTLGQLTLAEI